MKKVLVTIISLTFCAGLLTLNAAQKEKLTPEQQKVKKELIEKYDANKDGKLDKTEISKMSDTDKEQWTKLRGGGKKKQTK